MSRPPKKKLEYFHMDTDIFENISIRSLINQKGGNAISIYTILLCSIYNNGYYTECGNELLLKCSEITGFDKEYVYEVIKTCISLGLFSKELFDTNKVLTSRSIQERYKCICMQKRRVCNIVEYELITQKSAIQPKKPEKIPKQTAKPLYEIYSLTLEQEIEMLKKDECWLDQLQILHGMEISWLRNKLDDFRVQCYADGKSSHTSLADAKHHFNAWVRYQKNKQQDDKNITTNRTKRRGSILSDDEKKAYGASF